MKLNIQSSVILESKALLLSVTKKVRAFAKGHSEIQEIDVKLKQDIVTGNRTTEIYLKMSGKNIYAIQGGRNFDMATDKSIVKLQSQLNKKSENESTEVADPSTETPLAEAAEPEETADQTADVDPIGTEPEAE